MKTKTITFTLRTRLTIAAVAVVAISIVTANPAAAGTIAITEWMYNVGAGPGEYFELTNVGTVAVDMTGWSQDDSTGEVGKHPMNFGTVQPGESVIGTQATVSAFRSYWGLSESVKVISYGDSDSLGRADAINLWDNAGVLVDHLTFDDQNGVDPHKGPRTSAVSGNIPLDALFDNTASAAVLSYVGDGYLSHRDGGGGSGDLGNPGVYTPYVAAPEPSSLVLLGAGFVGLLGYAWRKRR
jgi:hypothetical protein